MTRDRTPDSRTNRSSINRRSVLKYLGVGATVSGMAGATSAVMGNVDTGKINLTAICVDTEDDLAKFRVTNDNDTAIEATWKVYGTDHEGTVPVKANTQAYFTVPAADDGSATVKLYYDGTEVGTKASNTQKECDLGEPNVDTGKINLTAICTDKIDDLAKFRVTNDNEATVEVTWDVYGTDHDGSLMVGGGSEKYFVVPTADDGSATVRLFYAGTKISTKASNTQKACDLGEENVDPDEIRLTATCTDTEDDLARFRVTNDNEAAAEVMWDVYGTDHEGTLMLEDGATKFFMVPTADDGSATVRLFYEDDQIEVKASNTQKACDLGTENVDPDDIRLTAICVDKEDDLAKFRVMNNNEKSVDVSWDVYGTDHSGDLTVGGGGTNYFMVPTADDGSATVRLFYEDEEVEVKASNTQKECDLGEQNGMDAFQLDLACGEVIEGIGDSEDAYYGRQGRLVQAVSMLDDGTLTRSFNHPHGDSRTVMKDGCELTYGRFDYDVESGKVMVTVSLDEDCDGKTLTLAGYELPEGTTEFQRKRAGEQELVDYQTMTLEGGEEQTLVIDLDD